MSVQQISKVIDLPRGVCTRAERSILVYLANFAAKDGSNVYPKVRTLAEKHHVTERWVRLLLAKLCEKGLLVVVGNPGPGRPKTYRLALEERRQTQVDLPLGRADRRQQADQKISDQKIRQSDAPTTSAAQTCTPKQEPIRQYVQPSSTYARSPEVDRNDGVRRTSAPARAAAPPEFSPPRFKPARAAPAGAVLAPWEHPRSKSAGNFAAGMAWLAANGLEVSIDDYFGPGALSRADDGPRRNVQRGYFAGSS